MKRKYSNSQIKRAGKVLSGNISYESVDYDFARSALTYWRTIHAYPINTFQSTLRAKLVRLKFRNYLIAQRLKRSFSIISKLERFPNMKLSTMQDIAGIRAIVKNVTEVKSLEANYRSSKFTHKLIDSKDYITTPAESGYRGIHLIYEYSKPNHESDGLKIELQIRSKLQHNWATAVETMGTFLNHSLKSSQGPIDWLNYFSLVSAGFAHLEKCEPPMQYKNISKHEIFKMIIENGNTLNIDEKLRGFTVAADHIFHSNFSSKYNLSTLNINTRIAQVKSYSGRQLKQANEDYTSIEKEIDKGAPLQAVLVSTSSIDSLRKAYPSYFLDTRDFLDKLELINYLSNKNTII